MLPTKICYNFYPFSPWSSHNGQVLVVLICLAESLSFISSSIRPSYRQKWMAKSRRVWYLLRTPHWLARVKAKKSTTQGWVNCLTGVAMTLMEWYPFRVYYKITESFIFVFWFIFIVGHHSDLCLMIYKLSLYSPNIPLGISSPGNPQKLDLNYQYLILYYSTVKLIKKCIN